MTENNFNSLQRCITALKFMGIYLQRTEDTTLPQHIASSQIDHSSDGPSQRGPAVVSSGSPRPPLVETASDCSTWRRIARTAWYVVMNVLYLVASGHELSQQDYSRTSFAEIILNIWYLVSISMILFSLLTCAMKQRSFCRLFATIAKIPRIDSKHGRFCSTFDAALVLSMVITRTLILYYDIKQIMAFSNDKRKQTARICSTFTAILIWAFLFTFVVSFNFLVCIITRYFKQTSSALNDNQPEETTENTLDCVDGFTGGSPRTSKFKTRKLLRHVEETLLLIDRGIEQTIDVFSWVFIFLSIMFMCDLVFGLYTVATKLQSGDLAAVWSLAYATEAFFFLHLIHNPADALSDAEEAFILRLREFMFHLDNEVFVTNTAPILFALQRPRRLTLSSYGNIGRSSFINTLAFMLSYVVVAVQFSDTSKPAQSA
ncbi:7TM chemoreceptor [Trinorchestia longiramus]|nr:7TM chemoreceptor [Trinorchestia longiramus]